MPLILKKRKRKLFPPDWYIAEIKSVKKEIETRGFRKDDEVIRVTFQTNYKETEGERLWEIQYNCTPSLDDKANLYKVVKVVLGRELEEDEEFDTESLVGKKVKIKIETQKSKETGREYSKISDVSAYTEKKEEAAKEEGEIDVSKIPF